MGAAKPVGMVAFVAGDARGPIGAACLELVHDVGFVYERPTHGNQVADAVTHGLLHHGERAKPAHEDDRNVDGLLYGRRLRFEVGLLGRGVDTLGRGVCVVAGEGRGDLDGIDAGLRR